MADITYDVRIDWDMDGGFDIGDFEIDLEGWTFGGSVPPTVVRSTVRAYHGIGSCLITWGVGGSFPGIQKTVTGLTSGRTYGLSAWVYVPTSGQNLLWAVPGIGTGVASTVKDAWVEITYSFIATGTTQLVQIWPQSSPAGGETGYADLMRISWVGENVTSRTLDRGSIKVQYGRDQARALSPIAPGQGALEIDNESKDYSPDNVSSPLYGSLLPGRRISVYAFHNQVAYNILRANLEEYEIDPSNDKRSVTFTAIDPLGILQTISVSTRLYQTIRTGEALGVILDEIGWTAGRDIDLGCSVLPLWWVESQNALDAVKDLLGCEGLGAMAYIGESGDFIFRDRSAHLTRTESNTVQATFTSTTEPAIGQDIGYDVGWRDIYNSVSVDVEERTVDVGLSVVYEDEVRRTIAAGETLTINATGKNLFIDAVTPSSGTDYTVVSGTVSVSLSRTSGESTVISLRATTAAVVAGMRIRAYKMVTLRNVKITASDSVSIENYRTRSLSWGAPYVGVNDARAIAELIVATHRDRLPIVVIKLINSNDTRTVQLLSRNLGDRVRLTIPEASVDSDFSIERIEHVINVDRHETFFGCEKIPSDVANVFVLDVSLLNTGTIGRFGLVSAGELFILDSPTQGLLGSYLLGH